MLYPDTKILTGSGDLVSVDEINIGDIIQSPIGKTEVLGKKEHFNVPLCKVMFTGMSPIYCSPESTFFLTQEIIGYNYIKPIKNKNVIYYKNDIMELILIDQVYILNNTERLISLKVNETFNLLVNGHIVVKA